MHTHHHRHHFLMTGGEPMLTPPDSLVAGGLGKGQPQGVSETLECLCRYRIRARTRTEVRGAPQGTGSPPFSTNEKVWEDNIPRGSLWQP